MNPLDELRALTILFPEPRPLFGKVEHVASAAIPAPYRKLLAHNLHMTVVMESHYESPVDVQVLDRRMDGDIYSRKIILLKHGTSRIVQFGIVRFDFQYVSAKVRAEILQGDVPLGRVLIQNDVLRHIDLGAILKITAGEGMAGYLQCPVGTILYGRLATIFCNQSPAIDLLEICAPLDIPSAET